MCGIAVLSGKVPAQIAALAIAGAGARGPHTHGWAINNNSDGWTVLRFPGRLIYATVPFLYSTHIKDIFIGHSRLATSGSRAGDAPLVSEAQPYASEGTYLVAHNGTIPGELLGDALPGDVDTRTLLRGLEDGSAPVEMLGRTGRPQAVVWAVENAVWAARVDGDIQPAHPLYLLRGKDWAAVSSGQLPEGKLLAVGKAVEIQ